MKILHIIYQMLTGGAETMLVDIANLQVASGHDVELLIVNKGEDESVMSRLDKRVKVSRFNREPGSKPYLLMLRLNMFILRRRPDIAHLHMHKLTGLIKVRLNRTLFTVHDMDMPMVYAARSNMAAISDAVLADVKERVPDAKIRLVRNGIITSAIERRPARETPSFHIVQVGRLMASKKGQDILIDAVALLLQKGFKVEATFIGDGADRAELEAQSLRLGIADRIHFTGAMDRESIYKSLKDYDIMCHPSRYEGFGLTIAEGMAAGLPLVLPEFGGPWEVADSGRLCESFRSGDATDCARALEKVIENYPSALQLAQEAKDYAIANFNIERTVKEYETLYNDLIQGKKL